jgi:hypothetical protein
VNSFNGPAVRDAETSAQPSTFGAEIEGQFRVINEKSGPIQ